MHDVECEFACAVAMGANVLNVFILLCYFSPDLPAHLSFTRERAMGMKHFNGMAFHAVHVGNARSPVISAK